MEPLDLARPGSTLVTFLLDRTGSMASILDDTIGGFNTYIATLKTEVPEAEFTLLTFDSVSIDKVHVCEIIGKVTPLTRDTYVPRASTPLIDAGYKTIKAVEAALRKRTDKPKIIVCFQTDGFENASTQHTWDQLNQLIKEKMAEGWKFNFMGASIDAYVAASRMGVERSSTVSYDSTNTAATQSVFAASASAAGRFSSGRSRDTSYTMGEKRLSGDAFDPDLNPRPSVPPATAGTASKKKTEKKPIVDDITL